MALNSDTVNESTLYWENGKGNVAVEGITAPANCKECFESRVRSNVGNSKKLVEVADEPHTCSSNMDNFTNTDEILEKPVKCTPDAEYKCICGLSVKHVLKGKHNCISELRQVIENQASIVVGLQDSLKKVRKYIRIMEKRILEREAEYKTEINGKLGTLRGNLDEVMTRDIRRCSGRCRKHVQTEKCLCRGFTTAAPHVCCGKQGGICDC